MLECLEGEKEEKGRRDERERERETRGVSKGGMETGGDNSWDQGARIPTSRKSTSLLSSTTKTCGRPSRATLVEPSLVSMRRLIMKAGQVPQSVSLTITRSLKHEGRGSDDAISKVAVMAVGSKPMTVPA